MTPSATQPYGRGAGAVAAYVIDGYATLEALLAEARVLTREGFPDGARCLLARFAARLERHLRLEEHVVFPLYQDRHGASPAIATLVGEHARIRQLVADVERAEEARALLRAIDTLAKTVRSHHRKERAVIESTRNGLALRERRRNNFARDPRKDA